MPYARSRSGTTVEVYGTFNVKKKNTHTHTSIRTKNGNKTYEYEALFTFPCRLMGALRTHKFPACTKSQLFAETKYCKNTSAVSAFGRLGGPHIPCMLPYDTSAA